MEESLVQIDIEKILKSKTNKKVPKFAIRLLEKIIHQQQINDFLKNHQGVNGINFIDATLDYLKVKIHVHGIENVPANRTFIFASNHPLGGIDGMALASIVHKNFGHKICFLVNNLLMNMTPLAELFVPINIGGGNQSRDLNKKIEQIFQEDKQFLVFPAGSCSRKIDGKIQDFRWKKTFITKSQEHKRDIIPVFFEARNSNFYYNIYRFRQLLGIRFNIEMLFLPDEMFKQKGKIFSVTFGEPIPWQTFDKSKSPAQWAQYVREKVYRIPLSHS